MVSLKKEQPRTASPPKDRNNVKKWFRLIHWKKKENHNNNRKSIDEVTLSETSDFSTEKEFTPATRNEIAKRGSILKSNKKMRVVVTTVASVAAANGIVAAIILLF